MNPWRVTAIANPYGCAYALDVWDSMTMAFSRDAATLACLAVIDDRKRVTTEYRATRLGDEHYELVAPEPERRAILDAFSRHCALDRSWLDEGEPEVWELTLQHNEGICSLVKTVHLSLRG